MEKIPSVGEVWIFSGITQSANQTIQEYPCTTLFFLGEKNRFKPHPVLWSHDTGQQIACFDSCQLTIPKWATKVIETLFDTEALIPFYLHQCCVGAVVCAV